MISPEEIRDIWRNEHFQALMEQIKDKHRKKLLAPVKRDPEETAETRKDWVSLHRVLSEIEQVAQKAK